MADVSRIIDISVVIPCYYSAKTVPSVVEELHSVFETSGMNYEIVLVSDGCKDNTFEIAAQIAGTDDRVVAVDLAKNSGQYAALLAGFSVCRGRLIATCEDDGQTDVSAFPAMIQKLEMEKYDVVTVSYEKREQPSAFRRMGTRIAVMMSKLMISKPDNVEFTITFVARRFVIEEIIKYRQPYPFMEGLIFRTTQNVGNVISIQKGRMEGKSGYNLKKLFELWMNGFTSFSIKPLRVAALLGVVAAMAGFFYGLLLVIRKLLNPGVLIGYTSIVAIFLFMSGVILIVLGVIGEYIGRIYMSINGTPQYVIKNIVGSDTTRNKCNQQQAVMQSVTDQRV